MATAKVTRGMLTAAQAVLAVVCLGCVAWLLTMASTYSGVGEVYSDLRTTFTAPVSPIADADPSSIAGGSGLTVVLPQEEEQVAAQGPVVLSSESSQVVQPQAASGERVSANRVVVKGSHATLAVCGKEYEAIVPEGVDAAIVVENWTELVVVDFDSLVQTCPDTVGWIQIDGLDISYPVVQGEDNAYYLDHDASCDPSYGGAIFLDAENEGLTDPYALVYGHNLQNGGMFGTLSAFEDAKAFEEGPRYFSLYTPDAVYRYEVFAVQVVDPDSPVYTVGWSHDESFGDFLAWIVENSDVKIDADVDSDDQVVTLSTCSDHTKRLVVSGKLVAVLYQ